MKFRFVFVGPEGAEVEVASVEALRARVLAGDLGDETLLYDGLTREWAPARVHPIYRLIRDGMTGPGGGGESMSARPVSLERVDATPTPTLGTPALGGDPPSEGSTPVGDDLVAGARPDDDDLLGFDLAPAAVVDDLAEDPAEVDHEALFWEEKAREQERAALDEGATLVPIPPRFDPAAGADATDASGGDARDPVRRLRPAGAQRSGATSDPDLPAPDADRVGPLDAPEWRPPRPPRAWRQEIRAEVPRRQAALMMMLAAIGGWAIADAWVPTPAAEEPPEMVHVASAYRVSPYFTKGHVDVRSAAFEDMLRGMDGLRARMDVDAPPEGWLGDAYFADPAAYAEVAVYWGKYGALVDALRAEEEQLFRSGFVSRLQRKGITGTVLTIEVARALQEFRQDRPRRELLYTAMEELAAASLALHEALLVDAGLSGGEAPVELRRSLELERVVRAMALVSGNEDGLEQRLGDAGLQELGRLLVQDVRG